MSEPNEKHECPHDGCEREFDTQAALNSHRGHSHDPRVEVECKQCGTVEEIQPCNEEKHSFCSRECQHEWRRQNWEPEDHPNWSGGDVEVTCEYCGETYEVNPAQVEETKYCSRECKWEAGRVRKDCKWCGEEFIAYKARENKATFCSMECRTEWQSETWVKEDHPSWQGGMVELECEYCGGSYSRKPKDAEKSRFCSRECKREAGRVRKDCKWCGEEFTAYKANEEVATFCSMECKNEWLSENMGGEDNPFWKGGYEPYYGPNWKSQRRRARERDDHACQACGATKEELGQEPDVHHIKPFREFVDDEGNADYEAANDLDNLVTLCRPCHREYEGLPVVPRIAD
jgi:hypothetical protein